jgi:hypothetical protein
MTKGDASLNRRRRKDLLIKKEAILFAKEKATTLALTFVLFSSF